MEVLLDRRAGRDIDRYCQPRQGASQAPAHPLSFCFSPLLLQVYELEGPELKLLAESEQPHGLKCGSLGASTAADRHLAAGDFGGRLQTFDLERPAQPVFLVQAHRGVVNALDAFGGQVCALCLLCWGSVGAGG
jgi:hypothetical protein